MINANLGKVEMNGSLPELCTELEEIIRAFKNAVAEKNDDEFAEKVLDEVIKVAREPEKTDEEIDAEIDSLKKALAKDIKRILKEILEDE